MEKKEKHKIVVVDDEPDFLALMREWLEPQYELVTLMDGRNLREQLESLEPDLLILDVMLPPPNGFEVCRQIMADPRLHSLPILFLTASHRESDFFKNLEVGGSSYLTKPISRARLLAKIHELLALATTWGMPAPADS